MARPRLLDLLRLPPAEVLAHLEPDAPALEGVLFDDRLGDEVTEAELARAWRGSLYAGRLDRERLLRDYLREQAFRHRYSQLSGHPLCSEAATAFVLDGVTYPSVRRFYEALKVPDDERRARFVAGATRQEVGVGRGRADATFEYGGDAYPVGSRPHLQLVARAVSAKVAAHPAVVAALRATGRRFLYMGHHDSQPLGRAMPFALMVERLRL